MMQRRQVLRWGCGLLGAIAVANALAKETRSTFVSKSDKLIWRERALIGFGTTLWIKAAHDNADQLEQDLKNAYLKSKFAETIKDSIESSDILYRNVFKKYSNSVIFFSI